MMLSAASNKGSQASGKSGERLGDRFIPSRMGENLESKFDAVSTYKEEESKYNSNTNS
jgi:hypothetical protein